jgi:NAD(P)H-quinone oxidoreductase subunit I
MLTMQLELLKQLFRKAFTNPFPAKRAPKSVLNFLKDVGTGKVELNPPVKTPEGFRGRLKYHEDKCIGCGLCTQVCPAAAVVMRRNERKIDYHLFRCTFCGECVKICPVKALEFSRPFSLFKLHHHIIDIWLIRC